MKQKMCARLEAGLVAVGGTEWGLSRVRRALEPEQPGGHLRVGKYLPVNVILFSILHRFCESLLIQKLYFRIKVSIQLLT